MYYGFNTVNITPKKPVKQAGHIQQVNPVSKVHDELEARIVCFEDDTKVFINISCDVLGFNYNFESDLKKEIASLFDKPLTCVVSATHTHYAGDTTDSDYYTQCLKAIAQGIRDLELIEGNLSVSYKTIPFEQTGTSRISNHKALVLLNLIQIYDEEEEILNIINYNCHPTILSADTTDYFSGDYVGYVMKALQKENSAYFTFLQGAAGDVSTRFTRKGQDYDAVIDLGDKLVAEIKTLKEEKTVRIPMTLGVDETRLDVSHEFGEIDLSKIPANLSERELQTIEYGKIMRERLKNNPSSLQKDLVITRLSLGCVNVIFAPNEMFSYFLAQLDTSKAFLACYSNGYSPYITPLDKVLLTYETFTDVLSHKCKLELVETIKKYN